VKIEIAMLLLTLIAAACGADRAPAPDAAMLPACPGSGALLCTHGGICNLPDGGTCGRE